MAEALDDKLSHTNISFIEDKASHITERRAAPDGPLGSY